MMTNFREAAKGKGILQSQRSGESSRQYATTSSFNTLAPKKVTMAIELALFQKICTLLHSDASLENYFQFELSHTLLSLFDEAGM